mgnify:CR=1 FL=1
MSEAIGGDEGLSGLVHESESRERAEDGWRGRQGGRGLKEMTAMHELYLLLDRIYTVLRATLETVMNLHCLTILFLFALAVCAKDPIFLIHQIGTDRSEGVAVFDMDRDGQLDVTSGAYWYKGPDWARHAAT